MTEIARKNFAVPSAVRCAGVLALVQGIALVITCAGIDGLVLWKMHPSSQAKAGCLIFSLLATIPAALLPIGGALLSFGKRAGRTILLVYAWIAIPLLLIGALLSTVAFNSMESGNQPAHIVFFHTGIASASIFFTIILTWLLFLGRARDWSDAVLMSRRPPPMPLSPDAVQYRQTQVTAILSIIFAFLPPPLVMQMLSLGLGLQALGAIRRSGGRRTGRALAIVGCSVSLLMLLMTAVGVGAAVAGFASDSSSREGGHLVARRLLELNVAQQAYRNLKRNPQTPGADCSTSVSDLLNATSELSPMEANTDAEVRAADATALGDRATPYHGYLFTLVHFEDWGDQDSQKNWAILAWPTSSSIGLFPVSRDAWMLGSDGQISPLKYTPGGVPQHISRSQIEQWRLDSYNSIEETWTNNLDRHHAWSDAVTDQTAAQGPDAPAASDTGAALYRHGLAEAQLPGRELRAICWFKAYLAVVPQGQYADGARQQIDQLNQSISGRTEAIFKRMGELAGGLAQGTDEAAAAQKTITDLRDRLDSADTASATADAQTLSAEQRRTAWENYEKGDLDDPIFIDAQKASGSDSSPSDHSTGAMSFDDFSRRANDWAGHLIEIRQGAPEKPPEGTTLLLHSDPPSTNEF